MVQQVFEKLEAQGDIYLGTYEDWYCAVSYTHLRAHETVLDLVCRLLLEKKKTNQDKHDT